MPRKITIFFLIILTSYFIILSSPVHALETTIYLGSLEKTLETKESKVYVPVGNAVAVITIVPSTRTVTYLYPDHLGSTVLVTDNKGERIDNLTYYPYGNTYSPSNSQLATRNPSTDKLYTGQRLDSDSNLYYYNARYYDQTTGHFLSSDKAEGGNRYAYVGNNPIMRNDPTGNYEAVLDNGPSGYNGLEDRMNASQMARDLDKKYGVHFYNSDLIYYENHEYQNYWQWYSNEIEPISIALEKIVAVSNNQDIAKGIWFDKEYNEKYIGYTYLQNDVTITSKAYRSKSANIVNSIIHEIVHNLKPKSQASQEQFVNILAGMGIVFPCYETRPVKNGFQEDEPKSNLTKRRGRIISDSPPLLDPYALTDTDEAFAVYGKAFFVPESYSGQTLSGTSKAANVGTRENYKKLYPKLYDYYNNLFVKENKYQKGEYAAM